MKKDLKNRLLVGLSGIMLFIGFLIFYEVSNQITGNVIGLSSSVSNYLWRMIGIVLIVGGISMATTAVRSVKPDLESLTSGAEPSSVILNPKNIAQYVEYVKSLRLEERRNPLRREIGSRTLTEQEFYSQISRYGVAPEINEKEEWITLYHAYPNRMGSNWDKNLFIDPKKLKRGGFYLSSDPILAMGELSEAETDINILKVQIAKSVYDDLNISEGHSHISSGKIYKIPKESVELANKLYDGKYIVLGRGR